MATKKKAKRQPKRRVVWLVMPTFGMGWGTVAPTYEAAVAEKASKSSQHKIVRAEVLP